MKVNAEHSVKVVGRDIMAFSKWLTANVLVLILMAITEVFGENVTICSDTAREDINNVIYLYVKLIERTRSTPWILLDRAVHLTVEGKQLSCFDMDHMENYVKNDIYYVGAMMIERSEHVDIFLHFIYIRYGTKCSIFEFKRMLLATDETGPEFSSRKDPCNSTVQEDIEMDLDYLD